MEKEFITIRIYRKDRHRLALNMKYGETMADMIHRLTEKVDLRREGDIPPSTTLKERNGNDKGDV